MNGLKSLAAALLCASALFAQAPPRDPGWPRTFSNGGASVVVYQPQVDSWDKFQSLAGRCAFAFTASPGQQPLYGTFRFSSDTLVDADRKVVLLRNIRTHELRISGAPPEVVSQLLPKDAMVVSLDRLLAFLQAKEVPQRTAQVLTEPPVILVSMEPAALVIIDGEPVLLDVEGTSLRRVVNTNWDLYQDRRTNLIFLRASNVWFRAPDWKGPYAPASDVPAGLTRVPTAEQKQKTAPSRIFVVNKPAELIVVGGQPVTSPIPGTQIASISNTESDLFLFGSIYYFLTSGRWFRAASLQGPWQYASADLPGDFKRIPSTHPKAHVLASVPGTREAEDAVLLASIPRTAEVSRADAKADVQYVGKPEFVPVSGTKVSYARNTPNDVFRVGDLYYLCLQGVWFVSASPDGLWKAADKVAAEIYTIPESCPKYHVTYVRVYDSTPTTVVVGYTPGYYGSYVSGGVVVWGTGYYHPPYVAVGVAAAPVYWGAPYYTYGASVWYNPSAGVYTRGAAVYGPYGGYGAAAAYNPRTGTYAQGAGIYGPNGGAAAGRTYNPWNGNYSAGYSATNPYGSWGQGVVGNGDKWARGGYESTSRGTVAAGETSKGGRGMAFEGAGGNTGYAAKSASGDIYAGGNGNVYKRDNGQWYQNQNGSWNAMDKSNVQAQREQAAARDWGNRNAHANGGQRPQLSGGRRR